MGEFFKKNDAVKPRETLWRCQNKEEEWYGGLFRLADNLFCNTQKQFFVNVPSVLFPWSAIHVIFFGGRRIFEP